MPDHRRALVFLIPALLIVACLGAWVLLHQSVKHSLQSALRAELEAQAQVTGIRLNLIRGRLTVQRVELQPMQPGASSWKQVILENASLDFDLMDLFRAVTPADLEMGTMKIERDPDSFDWIGPLLLPATGEILQNQWPHWKARSLRLHHLSVTSPTDTIDVNDVHWLDHDLTIDSIQSGDFVFDRTRLTFFREPPRFRIDHFITHCGEGTITALGHWSADANEQLQIDYQLNRVPARIFLSRDWQILFQGKISGKGTYTGPLLTWEGGESKGSFEADEARLQAFPVLENLSLLAGVAGLTSVGMDTVRGDLHFHDQQFDFTDIIITKKDLLRWEGSLSIFPDQTLKGDTLLGLNPDSTGLLPGLKETIFTESRKGYDWTPVTISGTIEEPREDLSPRLKQVLQNEAGKAVKEGGQLLEQGIEKAKEWLDNWLKKKE